MFLSEMSESLINMICHDPDFRVRLKKKKKTEVAYCHFVTLFDFIKDIKHVKHDK